MTYITWFVALALSGAPPAQAPSSAGQRFDYLVRADFFAGIAGDRARMKRAMDLCEKTLAENPAHPEALVWHGAGLFGQAGAAFQTGDPTTGRTLYDRGIEEMDRVIQDQCPRGLCEPPP